MENEIDNLSPDRATGSRYAWELPFHWTKSVTVIFSAFLLLPLLGILGCSAGKANLTKTTTTPTLIQWVTLKDWTGTGTQKTEAFSVTESPWAIGWSNNPEMQGNTSQGILAIIVYSVSEPNVPVAGIANSVKSESDISYINQTGNFYLLIQGLNTSWRVQVSILQ